MNEKVIQELNKEWAGKRFVYRSKYGGEVIGTIESVFITTSFTMDPKSSHNFKENIDTKTPKGRRKGQTPEYLEVKPEEKYMAIRPIVNVRSTNGQTYTLDEIYVIKENSDVFSI